MTDLVINERAAFAFIGRPLDALKEVRAYANGSSRVLDSGDGIDTTSLELEGNLVSWTKDGARHSAPLE